MYRIAKDPSWTQRTPDNNCVEMMAASPDCRVIALAFASGLVQLRSSESGIIQYEWRPVGRPTSPDARRHKARITCLSFCRQSERLAIGHTTNTVTMWLWTENHRVGARMDSPALALAWSPHSDRLAVGLTSGAIQVFSSTDGECLRTLQIPLPSSPGPADLSNSNISALVWRSDGELLSVSRRPVVRVWNIDQGTSEPMFLRGLGEQVLGACFNPTNADHLCMIVDDRLFHLHVRDRKWYSGPEAHALDSLQAVSERFALLSGKKTVRLWTLDDKQAIQCDIFALWCATLSPDSNSLFAATQDHRFQKRTIEPRPDVQQPKRNGR